MQPLMLVHDSWKSGQENNPLSRIREVNALEIIRLSSKFDG